MVSRRFAQHIDAALVHILLSNHLHPRFDEFRDSTFWTDVAFFRTRHAGPAFITEFHLIHAVASIELLKALSTILFEEFAVTLEQKREDAFADASERGEC